jgi:hypothetical protein
MSDGGDEGPQYFFVTADGEEKKSSRDYIGWATATYPDGEIYEGDFVEGIRKGKGTYRYKDGDVYTGEWKDNVKHGYGTLTYAKQGEYKGFWENGRRHGEGVFTYKDTGDSYSGWWRFGQKEGAGTYCFKASGMKMVGDWKEGQMVKGKWIYPNGVYYEGPFENNKPSGEGEWHFPDGNSCKGSHTQKKLEMEEEEVEEGQPPPKQKYDVTWTSAIGIAASGKGVNAIER